MSSKQEAKDALDMLIRKSRIHLYKPIQIAEILFRARTEPGSINLLDLEEYRNQSKKWRDGISQELLGRVCTSSARFQDDLFNENAIPPRILNELGNENTRTRGAVEAYIYSNFTQKYSQLTEALNYALSSSKDDFKVKEFIGAFWRQPGLRRSIDKVYEIVVYSLFSTIISVLELKVEVSIEEAKRDLLTEFSDFAKMVMCLDVSTLSYLQDAKVFRVGVTNAADRGLDMYTNWGPAIQIKHLSLNEELAEEIVGSITSDRIVIVCKDAERMVILSLLNQIGWRSKIQSIITESDLEEWYEKALRGKYSGALGNNLLQCIRGEITNEFPSLDNMPDVLVERHYDGITDPFWS